MSEATRAPERIYVQFDQATEDWDLWSRERHLPAERPARWPRDIWAEPHDTQNGPRGGIPSRPLCGHPRPRDQDRRALVSARDGA